jgi:hypothetical protein
MNLKKSRPKPSIASSSSHRATQSRNWKFAKFIAAKLATFKAISTRGKNKANYSTFATFCMMIAGGLTAALLSQNNQINFLLCCRLIRTVDTFFSLSNLSQGEFYNFCSNFR